MVPLQAGLEPFPGFRLRQLLGRGGFGEVWEAVTPQGSSIALKFLPCTDNRASAKEISAIQVIRALHHPHLTRIDQVWSHVGSIVVAMELAEGSLLDLLEAYQAELNRPMVPQQVCLYLTQVADALDFLNSRHHLIDGNRVAIQHCDVKPSNMLLFADIVKLCDFGLSALTTVQIQFHRRAGTLEYTAPEVFQGRLSDWTDQYALAVSYCKLRGGRLPFSDTPGKFERDYARPEPDLSMLPLVERPIIARGLSRVPQNRWPTCMELMAQLAKVAK